MAISRSVRPHVLVSGFVNNIRERRTREDKRLFAHTVTVQQDSGAQLAVDVFVNDDGPAVALPSIGEAWNVVAAVSENSYGASLGYERDVTADDLDKIASALPSLAGK